MGVDVVTLALAKDYADEVAATGGNPEIIEQIIQSKISKPDWSVNNETNPAFIKNRTHYEQEINIEWDGNIQGLDSIEIMSQTDKEEISTFTMYKISDNFEYYDMMKSLTTSDFYVKIQSEDYNGTINGIDAGVDIIYLEENGKYYFCQPMLLYVVEDNTLVSFEEYSGTSITMNKGLWALRVSYIPEDPTNGTGQVLAFEKVLGISTKQLDLKYIPDIAFGTLEMSKVGTTATIKYTDRNNNIQTVTINDGEKGADGQPGYVPVRGTDYWTEADKAEIKSYVDNAILGGAW